MKEKEKEIENILSEKTKSTNMNEKDQEYNEDTKVQFTEYHEYRSKNMVTFSNRYKDSSIRLSDDKLTCYGDKGWSSAFVNNGADNGKWYYEIKIEPSVKNLEFLGYKGKRVEVEPYVRIGYACRYMRYDNPIGMDKYSYCVNGKNGKLITNSVSYDCMRPLVEGDVIGCYLNLKNPSTYNFDPRDDKKLYEFIQNGILCNPKFPPALKKNCGSTIFFSLNGEIKEVCFVDIYEGFFHPAVSLYMGACVKINLGPNFKYCCLSGYSPCIYMKQPIVI